MTITDVRVRLQDEECLKAIVNVTLDDEFVVRGMKIIHGPNGFFVSMPSRKRDDGTHRDICHPINAESRELFERAILNAYQQELRSNGASAAA